MNCSTLLRLSQQTDRNILDWSILLVLILLVLIQLAQFCVESCIELAPGGKALHLFSLFLFFISVFRLIWSTFNSYNSVFIYIYIYTTINCTIINKKYWTLLLINLFISIKQSKNKMIRVCSITRFVMLQI